MTPLQRQLYKTKFFRREILAALSDRYDGIKGREALFDTGVMEICAALTDEQIIHLLRRFANATDITPADVSEICRILKYFL